MKEARLTEEQIIGILQEHEAGAKCADLCRKNGMSEGTFYAWKAKYSGMTVSEGRHCGAIGPSDNGGAAEGAGGRERQTEEALGRADARHGGDEGTAVKKMVT
jgi:putative transposase